MRQIDEHGIARPLAAFLNDVARAGGALHVSLDVDFLDPSIAPAVGTTVPGGATLRSSRWSVGARESHPQGRAARAQAARRYCRDPQACGLARGSPAPIRRCDRRQGP
jgi:hypothetical protein